MSTASGFVCSRIDRSPRTVRLAVGDLLVLSTFLIVGELNHNVNPVESPQVVADTIAPFLIGWLVVAPLVGAYSRGATRSVRHAAVVAAGSWIGAAAVGLALRSTAYFHGSAPWTFALVVSGFGTLFFVTWRSAVAALNR